MKRSILAFALLVSSVSALAAKTPILECRLVVDGQVVYTNTSVGDPALFDYTDSSAMGSDYVYIGEGNKDMATVNLVVDKKSLRGKIRFYDDHMELINEGSAKCKNPNHPFVAYNE